MNAAGELYIGLMSGTSSDAIDAALVSITETSTRLLHSLAAVSYTHLTLPTILLV